MPIGITFALNIKNKNKEKPPKHKVLSGFWLHYGVIAEKSRGSMPPDFSFLVELVMVLEPATCSLRMLVPKL